jgi:peptidoglycan/LPS O-acetylase OafA/YrhL
MNDPLTGSRVQIVDCLRGIAALSVCCGHLASGNTGFPPDSILRITIGTYGWLGVEVFFVISGFVIPFALHRAGYQTRQYGTFLLKRLVRLDPPYLVTIFIAICVGYLAATASNFQGQPFHVSAPQVLLHFAYLNVLFGYPWLNPVFWTLAIEFQYYLLVGLLFSAIATKNDKVRYGLFGVMASLAILFPQKAFLFHWLFLFMLGMLAFQYRVGIVRKIGFLTGALILSIGSVYTLGFLIAAVGAATAVLIAFVQIRSRVLLFLGAISYSLYLIHDPIGLKVVNLGSRYVSGTWGRLAILGAGIILSIVAACVLYRFVEGPAMKWSSAIRYQPRRPKLVGEKTYSRSDEPLQLDETKNGRATA